MKIIYNFYDRVKVVKMFKKQPRVASLGAGILLLPACRPWWPSWKLPLFSPSKPCWSELGCSQQVFWTEAATRLRLHSCGYNNTFSLHFWICQLVGKAFLSQVSPGTLKWRTEIISSIIQAKIPFLLEFLWFALDWFMQMSASILSFVLPMKKAIVEFTRLPSLSFLACVLI